MATVIITLTDVEDGVTVKLDSDVAVDWENLAVEATDAHRMAVSMLRLYEHAHDAAEKMEGDASCGETQTCTRHEHTHANECCKNH